MKRTNSCTTKKSFAEISIFLASKWFFISIFVVTILCYMTPVYYGDGVSEMSTLELLRLKANPSFAIEPMQYQISVILPRAVQGYLAMFVPVLSALPFIVFQQAEKSGRYQRFYMFRSWRTCFAVWSNTFRIVLYRDGLLYLRHNYCRQIC